MIYKKGENNITFSEEKETVCPTREYTVPELEEAYDDDDTRSMGYKGEGLK